MFPSVFVKLFPFVKCISGQPDGLIWPSYSLNQPKPVQPPVNETHAATQPMVKTDELDSFPEPYSPSELYTDYENTHGPGK